MHIVWQTSLGKPAGDCLRMLLDPAGKISEKMCIRGTIWKWGQPQQVEQVLAMQSRARGTLCCDVLSTKMAAPSAMVLCSKTTPADDDQGKSLLINSELRRRYFTFLPILRWRFFFFWKWKNGVLQESLAVRTQSDWQPKVCVLDFLWEQLSNGVNGLGLPPTLDFGCVFVQVCKSIL